MLKSQEVRKIAPEMDPLRMGMGWTVEDLEKPQVLVESTYGQSHPGSAHLLELSQKAAAEIDKNGCKAAQYFATDICDGMSQGHDGGNYSLRRGGVHLQLRQIRARPADGHRPHRYALHCGHWRGDGCGSGLAHPGADRHV